MAGLVNPLEGKFSPPLGGFLELPTQDRTPGSFSFSPRRAWRRNIGGRHVWGLWRGSRLWGPNTVYPHPLAIWVRAPPPSLDRLAQFSQTLCPGQAGTGLPWSVFSPGSHCHFLSPGPGRQGMPQLQWFFQLSLFLQLPPILFLVPPIWVHIPAPLQASCMTSDRWLNLSDSSFLILEVKLLTPASISWGEAC